MTALLAVPPVATMASILSQVHAAAPRGIVPARTGCSRSPVRGPSRSLTTLTMKKDKSTTCPTSVGMQQPRDNNRDDPHVHRDQCGNQGLEDEQQHDHRGREPELQLTLLQVVGGASPSKSWSSVKSPVIATSKPGSASAALTALSTSTIPFSGSWPSTQASPPPRARRRRGRTPSSVGIAAPSRPLRSPRSRLGPRRRSPGTQGRRWSAGRSRRSRRRRRGPPG